MTDKRYKEGVSTYFEVLDANRELFGNELAYVQNYQASLASVIELYRALAADWMPEVDDAPEPEATESPSPFGMRLKLEFAALLAQLRISMRS